MFETDASAYEAVTSAPGGGGADYPVYVGYICCIVGVVFFGSNWVPVKKFETGDGE